VWDKGVDGPNISASDTKAHDPTCYPLVLRLCRNSVHGSILSESFTLRETQGERYVEGVTTNGICQIKNPPVSRQIFTLRWMILGSVSVSVGLTLFHYSNIDGIVKSRHSRETCPRPDRGTGIQRILTILKYWIPACAGMTKISFSDFLRDHQYSIIPAFVLI
jgi:hypothetical protein